MRRTTPRPGTLALVVALLAAGCGKGDKPAAEKGAPSGKPVVAVEVAPAAARDLTEGIDVTGTLAPKFDAEVKSEVSGAVVQVHVTEWQRVRKGDPLLRVDTRELELTVQKARAGAAAARAAASSAEASQREVQVALERAERELRRIDGLREAGLATRQALDDAQTQRDAARARAEVLQAQVAASRAQVSLADEDVRHAEARLDKATIRAPFDGVVAERLVNLGEVVGEMQKVVFRIVEPRLLTLTVHVPSAALGRVRVGQPLTFSVDAIPGRTFTGTVKFINPTVDPADRAVRVTAEVANDPEELRGGLFVKGFIVTGTRTGVLEVPRAALFNWDVAARRADLFLVEGESARRRTVTVGAAEGERVEVAAGLAAGERVVVRGGFALGDGDRVKVVGAGG